MDYCNGLLTCLLDSAFHRLLLGLCSHVGLSYSVKSPIMWLLCEDLPKIPFSLSERQHFTVARNGLYHQVPGTWLSPSPNCDSVTHFTPATRVISQPYFCFWDTELAFTAARSLCSDIPRAPSLTSFKAWLKHSLLEKPFSTLLILNY